MTPRICILLLAAGVSRRMNATKQLLPWGTTSLIGHMITTALSSSANSVFVVLGANHERIYREIEDKQVTVVLNKDWETGISSSIAAGIKEVLKRDQFEGVLILLCDQPLISRDYLDKMIDTFTHGKVGIAATSYQSKMGVPALFRSTYFAQLQQLKGDVGAASVISKFKEDCISLQADSDLCDLDTMEDYNGLHPLDGQPWPAE